MSAMADRMDVTVTAWNASTMMHPLPLLSLRYSLCDAEEDNLCTTVWEPCMPSSRHDLQVLRHAAAIALGSAAPDIDVHCTDNFLAGKHMSFSDVSSDMPRGQRILCGQSPQQKLMFCVSIRQWQITLSLETAFTCEL